MNFEKLHTNSRVDIHRIIYTAAVVFALIFALHPAAPAGAAQNKPALRKRVADLLSQRRMVYWYTDITDADFLEATADGTFKTAKMIEAGDLSAPYRERLLSLGVIAAAHVEIKPAAGADETYRALKKPLAAGWDAVAIDQFLRGSDYSAALKAIARIRKEFPAAVIAAWCETGAPVSALEPFVDLFIIDPAGPRDFSAFITSRNATAMDGRFNEAAAAVRNSGANGAKAIAKTIAAVCVCDSFDDSAAEPSAFVCDNKDDVDFRKLISMQLAKLRSTNNLSRGVALFSKKRAKPSTARFANMAAAAAFSNTGGAKAAPASFAATVQAPGFEGNAAAVWTLEGGRAVIVKYADSKLPRMVRMGHALTGSPQFAAVSHEAAGLRMEAVTGSCNSAMQTLKLEPGATYEVSAFITGERGGEKGSIWLFDKTRGRDVFSAFLPVEVASSFRWSNPSFLVTVPKDTTAVGLMLSDCDMMGPQAMWWDFVRVEKTIPASPAPSIVSALPINNSIEGYGFHLQWDLRAFDNVSYSLLQYSLDGVTWRNISTEFDGVYNTYWLPSGMPELPFGQIPPGQPVQFRVRIVQWGDKTTDWSAPFAAVMPRYDGGAAPVLNFASARSDKVAAAWLSANEKPSALKLQCAPSGAGADAKWMAMGDAKPGAASGVFAAKPPAGAAVCRLAAEMPGGVVYSNIVPLEK